jgi:hypothetical protein
MILPPSCVTSIRKLTPFRVTGKERREICFGRK